MLFEVMNPSVIVNDDYFYLFYRNERDDDGHLLQRCKLPTLKDFEEINKSYVPLDEPIVNENLIDLDMHGYKHKNPDNLTNFQKSIRQRSKVISAKFNFEEV